ncbi:MAG: glycosyltransferase [Bacteroidaceae bacterium]|nr:glycosyltransferase [Bacteroidaceae bacterium]
MDSLVSVIIPAFNASSFIGEAIQSVINQTYRDWELIIVDDCSTDNTIEVVSSFAENNSRIQLIKSDIHSGGYPSIPRNKGIESAKGRYIAFLDADDIWEPDKLDSQIALFDGNTPIVFSNYQVISKYGERITTIQVPSCVSYNMLLKLNYIACSSAIVDTKCTGAFAFPVIHYEDYALWLSLLRNGGVAINTGKIGFCYRKRHDSVSAKKAKAVSRWWAIYRREGLSVAKAATYIFLHSIRSLKKWMRLK